MKKTTLGLSASLLIFSEFGLSAAGGASMPWEGPLRAIMGSLTGPTAGFIALIAIVVCGALLIFGGDFSGFARNVINVVIASSIILGASNIITNLFPSSGAVLPDPKEKLDEISGALERENP